MRNLFARAAAPLRRQKKHKSLTKNINEVKVSSRCRENGSGRSKRWWECPRKTGDEEMFHRTNFNLLLLSGRSCNKLQIVKSRTPLGAHFKSAQRFCLLVSDLAWRTGRLRCSCCSVAPHLVGSTLAEIETLSPEVFSWHLYDHLLLPIATPTAALAIAFTINLTTHTPSCLPLTRGSQLQSSAEFWR